jgi:HK97 gp10 family phage protein
MRLKVELTGLEAVLEDIEDIVNEAKMERAMGKACAVVERSAKGKAPKGTGELRRSITSKVVNNAGVIEGIVYTPLEYAPYVEFGTGLFAENGNGRKDVPWHYKDDEGNWHSTSGMKPRPYMRPALNENRTKILRILKEGVGND